MRQVHHAGEKTFVDYSGKKPCIWDARTGERIEVELFVAVLGRLELHVRRGDAHAARA
jgi:transposase